MFTKKGISYGPAFGVGAATEAFEQADGRPGRAFIDCGENPPAGAIVYYWLPPNFEGAVRLTFTDAKGRVVHSFASDDEGTPPAKRPGTQPGLNRFVWDLKHRGPTKLDMSLVARRNKPFAEESDDVAGPAVVPGRYVVTLAAAATTAAKVGQAGETGRAGTAGKAGKAGKASNAAAAAGTQLEAGFAVVKDPRVRTAQRALEQQHALLLALYDRLSALNAGVNRARLLMRQLRDLEQRLGAGGEAPLRERLAAAIAALQAIEGVLVDAKRESPRDILRHPAGLNDTLVDLINVVAIADEAPTGPAQQVGDEIMAKVDAELAKLERAVAAQLPGLSEALRDAGVDVIGA
jgi:hypothetical protein